MFCSGWVIHFRKATLAFTSASDPLVTAMPAPCWTQTLLPSANVGQGRAFMRMSWLSVSLVITCLGKKVALELEPT